MAKQRSTGRIVAVKKIKSERPEEGVNFTAVREINLLSNSQLDKNTTPCPNKATDTLILNVTSKLINKAANSNQILESLTANNKNSDLINNVISNEVTSPKKEVLQQKGTMPRQM